MRIAPRTLIRAAGLCASLAGTAALALTPSEVFDKVSGSVWAVRGLDAQERPFRYGSAVVIGPGRLVTNCHVLAKAKAIQLRRENVLYEARLEHADLERDLCIVSAKNFSAPAVAVGKLDDVKVGQRVYAIGNPERLALTLSEGLVSGLRGEEGRPLLQTTAPLSPGSSGGGLFDENGALLGITSFGIVNRGRTTQNLNFALPAEWIAEVPERAKAMLAKATEQHSGGVKQAAAPVPGLPAVGATWRYGFRDRQYGGAQRVFTVRVSAIEGRDVRESFKVEQGGESSAAVDAGSVSFSARRLTSDSSLIELAPYFLSAGQAGSALPQRPMNYPGSAPWTIGPAQVQPEDVMVPAGTYKATRIDVRGDVGVHGSAGMAASANHIAARFHFTAWYALEVNRYVMARHQTWNSHGRQIGDEMVQLLEYRPN